MKSFRLAAAWTAFSPVRNIPFLRSLPSSCQSATRTFEADLALALPIAISSPAPQAALLGVGVNLADFADLWKSARPRASVVSGHSNLPMFPFVRVILDL